jgi:hypothetical protein
MMRQVEDDKTMDLELVRKPGREKVYQTAYEKAKAYRERHGLVNFSVDLPKDLVEQLSEYMRFKDKTRTEVMTKLISGQLLRKR